MERSKNSMRNILFGVGGQILNIIMSFAMRLVFTRTLGEVYLGVNGTFTNVLMVFSLADLGVGTAIIYALYKPVATGDRHKVQMLMKMYGRAYRIIGLVIIGLGLATTPFVHLLVKADQQVADLELIFLLFVVNTASTYFFAYKGTLITAHQKNYIVTNVVYGTSVLCYAAQIAIMLLTHNYILTLSIQVGTNILQNLITRAIANRMYPYIRKSTPDELPRAEKQGIYRNMRSLVFYRAGQVVINGTDSILISAMIGVAEAGFYSNYVLITTTIKNLLQQVFKAITASVGNLAALESDEKKYSVYNAIYFGNFWMFGFCTVCLWVLFNPFIELFFGAHMLLDPWVVFWVVLNFYLVGMRNVNITFRDTMGVFREGRFVPIIAAVLNIGISILLAPIFGLAGIFMGTTISTAISLLWMEPWILHRYGFKRSVWPYFGKYFLYLATTAAATVLTQLASSVFAVNSALTFLGRLALCLVIPNLIILGLFWRTAGCRALMEMLRHTLLRKLRRRRLQDGEVQP